MEVIIGGGLSHDNSSIVVTQLLYVILDMNVQLQTALLSSHRSRLRMCKILIPCLFLGVTLYAEGNMIGFGFVGRHW